MGENNALFYGEVETMNIPSDRVSRGSSYSGVPDYAAEKKTESAFAKYLDVDRQRQMMWELPPGKGLSSVYMQFMDDYRAWKAQRAEEALPDSQGWTEENLNFLRERYGGDDLSAFEIYEALDTMQDLGLISQKAKNCATGNCLIAIDMKSGICRASVHPDSKAAWLHGFDETPIVGFCGLEDILSWAKEFRDGDWPDCITHAEAVARGWV